MNQQQRKYIQKRMDDMFQNVKNAIKKKYTTESVRLTDEDMYDQLKSGKAKLRTKADFKAQERYGRNVQDYYKFTGEVKGSIDWKAIEKELAVYEKELNKAKDEVMLGDSATALKLLDNFTTLCNKALK